MVTHDHVKTDAQVQRAVVEELAWDTRLEGLVISVEVHAGVVTLLGEVATWTQRMIAESAARRVAGVAGVANGLQVDRASQTKADLDIAAEAVGDAVTPETLRNAIREALDRRTDHELHKIQIDIEAGRVTLHGDVRSPRERAAIVGALTGMRGVKNVVDHLQIA